MTRYDKRLMETADAIYEELTQRRTVELSAALRSDIRAAAERWSEHAGLLAIAASTELWAGNLEVSQELVARFEALGNLDATSIAIAATVYAYAGHFDKALEHFEAALTLDPDNREVLRQYPGLLLLLGRTSEAQAFSRQILRQYPESEFLVASVVTSARGISDDAMGQEAMDLLARHHPKSASLCLSLSRQASFQRDLVKAEEWARLAVASNNESYPGWEHLALVCRHLGKFEDAKQAAEYAISINCRSKVALDQLAVIARREGNLAKAAEYELRAASAVPFAKDWAPIFAAGKQLGNGDPKGAFQTYWEHRNDTNLWISRTVRKILLSDFSSNVNRDQKRELLDQMETAGDLTAEWYAARAQLATEDKDFTLAEDTINEGLSKFPNFANLRVERLRLHLVKSEFDSVDGSLKDIRENPFGAPNYYALTVELLSKYKLFDQAQTVQEILERRFPGSDVVLLSQAQLFRAQGKSKEAMAALQAARVREGRQLLTFGYLLRLFSRVALLRILRLVGIRPKKRKDDDSSHKK